MKYLLLLLMFVSFNVMSQTIEVKVEFESETRLVNQPKTVIPHRFADEKYVKLEDSCTGLLFKTPHGNYSFDIKGFKKQLIKNKTYKVRFYLEKRILKYEIVNL